MKFETGYKIKKYAPMVCSVLLGIGSYLITKAYGNHCTNLGYEAGHDDTMKIIENEFPDEFAEISEGPHLSDRRFHS